ncbi:MAG: hypothetical protein FWF13_03205 [Acidobacteria bacterium]|nr:hypothetical protein [Acidobacteriota bacterium]
MSNKIIFEIIDLKQGTDRRLAWRQHGELGGILKRSHTTNTTITVLKTMPTRI